MRILYGVQGTGNGHLTRARAMAAAFRQHPSVELDFVISGRAQDALFGVEPLGDFRWREGLSFATRDGKVSVMDTVSSNPWWKFWRDVRELDVSEYDLVVTDFEPVTAWAAKRCKVPSIGIGRQYAFYHAHPSLPISSLQRAMVRQFTPVDIAIGTHWQPLGSATLPPIIETVGDTEEGERPVETGGLPARFDGHQLHPKEYLIYLPFEPLADIYRLLRELETLAPRYHFHVFHPEAQPSSTANATLYAPSREQFKWQFERVTGVIANAGFGTSSEALMAGKKLLIKPLKGQFEQYANAYYLDAKQLAHVSLELQAGEIKQWLEADMRHQLAWPEVAPALASWLSTPNRVDISQFCASLWQASSSQRVTA